MMGQTFLMAAAAVHFIAIACLASPDRLLHIIVFQFYPAILALGLACYAFGRFMGWPV